MWLFLACVILNMNLVEKNFLEHVHKWFAHKNLWLKILALGNIKYELSLQTYSKVPGPNFVMVNFYHQLQYFYKWFAPKNLRLIILA